VREQQVGSGEVEWEKGGAKGRETGRNAATRRHREGRHNRAEADTSSRQWIVSSNLPPNAAVAARRGGFEDAPLPTPPPGS